MSKLIDTGKKVLTLNPLDYPGGIAIWGAIAPIYNTSVCPLEEGVHVHTRQKPGGPKQIDDTFDMVQVQLTDSQGRVEIFSITGEEAVNYNISTILNRRLKYLRCLSCGRLHTDKGYFAINYHQTHHCEHCGYQFDDSEQGISNPVMLLKEFCGDKQQVRDTIEVAHRKVVTKQIKWPGGMQIWGSNPAILWTSPKLEENGVHFHGYLKPNQIASADETFGIVAVDGFYLDPEMTRHFMVQNALSYLQPYLCTLHCPVCDNPHFDQFDRAIEPHARHICENCQAEFDSPNDRPFAVSNPLIEIVDALYTSFGELTFNKR